MKRLLLILGLVGLLIVGCSDNKDTPVPSPTPTQGPTSVVEVSPTPTDIPTPTEEPIVTPTPPPVPELRVHFIDVGQGDAILVDLGETEVLIDGGGKSPGVVDYLQDYVDGTIEVVVATHPSC